MKTLYLKSIDSILGKLLVFLFNKPPFVKVFSSNKFLIIRPGGIGDAVHLAPAICSIKKHYPQSHITILAERRNAAVFLLVPQVDQVLCYDIPREFLKALRGRYDVVIDTEQWHRLSAVVARLVRAQVRIGFDTNERKRLFTHLVGYSNEDYEAASFMHLLVSLEIYEGLVERSTLFLTIPVSALEEAVCLLKSLDGKPFVVIFPGASISERRWGAESFRVVARSLADSGYRIVVVGGRAERAEGDLIVESGGVNLAGLTTLAETAAVIARSKLVISGDSGVLHLAVGLDVPTVSLFGPGIAAKWAPRGEKHVVLNRQLSCSPCTRFGTTPPCPHGVRCMKGITVTQVLEAAVHILKEV